MGNQDQLCHSWADLWASLPPVVKQTPIYMTTQSLI